MLMPDVGAPDLMPEPDVSVPTLRPLGAACSGAAQCDSGFCAGGRCCDRACDSGCETCATGFCEAVPDGTRCGDAGCVGPTIKEGVNDWACVISDFICQAGACHEIVFDCCGCAPASFCQFQGQYKHIQCSNPGCVNPAVMMGLPKPRPPN